METTPLRVGNLGWALLGIVAVFMNTPGWCQDSPYRTKTFPEDYQPRFEDYATIEAYCDGNPVYSLGNITYLYGVSPQLLPGVVMQEGNTNPVEKIKPKKSWEIKSNPYGAEMGEPGVRTMWNDSQPMLPIHLIDGDPDTAWCSYGGAVPDAREEWIRIDLPRESMVSAVVLACSQDFALAKMWEEGKLNCHAEGHAYHKWAGRALPNELTIRTSRDAWHWETVYENKRFTGSEFGAPVVEIEKNPSTSNVQTVYPPVIAANTPYTGTTFIPLSLVRDRKGITIIKFEPRMAKQIWISGRDFKRLLHKFAGYVFSIGEVEVLDPDGNNLALLSRGAGVSTSSTSTLFADNRMRHDLCFGPVQYDLGLKWCRLGADNGLYCWQAVEKEKGKLEVDPAADALVTELNRNGIKIVMNMDVKANFVYRGRKQNWKKARIYEVNNIYLDHPGWAWESQEMLDGYLRYVEYMARHFKGRIHYYEIGNEWAGPRDIYEKAVRKIREIDPDARIMVGVGRMSQFPGMLREWLADVSGEQLEVLMPDAVGSHPNTRVDAGMTLDDLADFYWDENRKAITEANALGFKGVYMASEVYSWATYPPGPRELNPEGPRVTFYYGDSEMVRAKYIAQNYIGHAGLNMLAFQCNVYWVSAQVGQSLFRCPVPAQTISPMQPDPAYYTFRTICSVMDEWTGAEFPVHFDGNENYEVFTFRRSDDELMAAAWIPGNTTDGIVESKSDVTVPDVEVKRAWVIDLINGAQQELMVSHEGDESVFKGILIKDYPTLLKMTL